MDPASASFVPECGIEPLVLNLEVPLDFGSATQLIDKERIEWALPLSGPLL